MATMAPKLRAQRTLPRARIADTSEVNEAELRRVVRSTLENSLGDWKLVGVKIRRVEGENIEGFLKIDEGKGERLMVDFKATATQDGALSSVEVGGKKIALASVHGARRTR
jgi:RNase P/RNase MRP subunit POP5